MPAAAFQCLASFRGPCPNRSPGTRRTTEAAARRSRSSAVPRASLFGPPRIRSLGTPPGPSPSVQPLARGKCLRDLHLSPGRRLPVLVAFAAPQEDSKQSDIDVESVKDELSIKLNESRKAWMRMLESFNEEALKMQSLSQEVYEIYSERAMTVFKETSQKIKIQADQARCDLIKLANEISKEGKEYLSTATKNSPESIKDIVEEFASSTKELKDISKIRDFYLGIPYGGILAIGGFLSFMLTESLSAVRFGVILGCALFALSVSSLRAWRSGQSSTVFLKGQTAIAAMIFIREWYLLYQRLSFPSFVMTLVSGAMLVFYFYRMIIDGKSKGSSLEETPEN